MNIRDLSTLERTSSWLDELVKATQIRGTLYGENNALAQDITRKAKALKTVIEKMQEFLERRKE